MADNERSCTRDAVLWGPSTHVKPSPGSTADLPAAGGAKTHPLLDQVKLPALSLSKGEQRHKSRAAGGHRWISAELLAARPAAGCQPAEKPGGARKQPGTRSMASPSRSTARSREPPRPPSPAKPIWFYSFRDSDHPRTKGTAEEGTEDL